MLSEGRKVKPGARWTWDDDLFLAAYFDAVGDMCGWHDLGKPEGAATKRVAKLKACGAWEALKAYIAANYTHKRAYFVALGRASDVAAIDEFHVGEPNHFAGRTAIKEAGNG